MNGKRIRGGKPRRPIYSGIGGRVARAWDGLVDKFAPGLAFSMRQSRIRSSALLAYEAARITPQNPRMESGSADAEILPDLQKLRDLSRGMIRDDAHAAAVINIHEECIVGEGIAAKAACTTKETGLGESECKAWNEACQAEWDRWAEDDADATGMGTFSDLQGLALRCFLQDGDTFGHAVIGGDATIACELIDADRVESPNGQDTESIRGGVELDMHGRRIAFHVLPNHPSDAFIGAKVFVRPVPVPAEDNGISIVQHFFKRTRAGQTRGVPLLTPTLPYLRNLHHYLDSELIAARAASNFAMFIKRSVDKSDVDLMPVSDIEQPGGQSYIEELSPGIVEYLNEGEEPVPFNPNRPGSAFDPFVTRVLRAIASATGLAYEVVCRDFGRMNLSSARALLREMKRGFDLTRRRFVRAFCQPWFENVIRMAIGSGRLRPPAAFAAKPKAFLRAQWVAPVFGMVDPETDVKGSVLSIDANLSDQWSEAAARGLDAEQVLRARARFYKLAAEIEKEHKLEPGTLTKDRPQRTESVTPPGAAPAKPGAPGAPGKPPQKKPEDDDEDAPDRERDDAEQPAEARQ